MKKLRKILCIISAAAICTLAYSCEKNSSGESSSEVDILNNGAESVVPSKTELIENAKAAGYEVSEFDNIYDLQVSGERVLAQKREPVYRYMLWIEQGRCCNGF